MPQHGKNFLETQKSDPRQPLRHRGEGRRVGAGQAELEWQDCREGEAEVLRESGTCLTRASVVINLEGVVYTGEYDFATAGDYMAGEWQGGDRIPVRLAGDRLYLRRPDGRELETQVVRRIG
jgi:hypothetical protein